MIYDSAPAPVVTPAPAPEKAPAPKKEEDGKEASIQTRAKLTISVPADAKLYIDDKLMKTTSATRTYSTPALEDGQLYYYIVRVEVTRDGKTQSDTKRVILKAGERVQASFDSLEDKFPTTRLATTER